jgi:hypothetical protein
MLVCLKLGDKGSSRPLETQGFKLFALRPVAGDRAEKAVDFGGLALLQLRQRRHRLSGNATRVRTTANPRPDHCQDALHGILSVFVDYHAMRIVHINLFLRQMFAHVGEDVLQNQARKTLHLVGILVPAEGPDERDSVGQASLGAALHHS